MMVTSPDNRPPVVEFDGDRLLEWLESYSANPQIWGDYEFHYKGRIFKISAKAPTIVKIDATNMKIEKVTDGGNGAIILELINDGSI